MQRRPTIVDVAQAAGVSKSTVSLVLQASPLVKLETAAAVRRAMVAVGYVYDRAVMADEGLPPFALHGRPSRAFGREAAQRLTRDHPEIEAAICFNDLASLGMISGMAELGRKVGRDFRLVGFDDIEECAQVWPQLSSVRCDIAGFARHAAGTMLDWLESGARPEPEFRAGVELIVRDSSLGAAA